MYNIPTTGLGDSFEGLTEPNQLASIGGSALKGASMGAAFGGVGGIFGGILGAGAGMFQYDQNRKAYDNQMVKNEQAKQASTYMRNRQQGLSALDNINQGQFQQRIGYTDMFNI